MEEYEIEKRKLEKLFIEKLEQEYTFVYISSIHQLTFKSPTKIERTYHKTNWWGKIIKYNEIEDNFILVEIINDNVYISNRYEDDSKLEIEYEKQFFIDMFHKLELEKLKIKQEQEEKERLEEFKKILNFK